MRALLVAVLLAPVLAGCLAGPDRPTDLPLPSAPAARFPVLDLERVWIPASSDGVGLHTMVWRPDTTSEPEWRAPVVLVMTPYTFDTRASSTDAPGRPRHPDYAWLVDDLVPRGYAVAFSEVRGTGDSGGCLEQTAEHQRQDGHDVVETLAAEPWSNGRVGMFGRSYRAEAQIGSAALAPPALRTIVPVASVSGQYEWNFYEGVPFTLQSFSGNFFYMVGSGAPPPGSLEGALQYPTRYGCHPEMLAQGLDTSGDWNAYWEVRELRKLAADIEAPVLYVHGLQDWNVRPVAVRDMIDRFPPDSRVLLGQWAHDFPDGNRVTPEWSRPDWKPLVLRWFDHFLLGVANGVLDDLPPVSVQDSAGRWRAEPAFPPPDVVDHLLHLAPEGLVRDDPGTLDEPLRYRENTEGFARAATGLPVPTAPSDPFPEALVLESAPLDADLHWSGWPVLRFEAALVPGFAVQSATGEIDAHFAANLHIVAPDGTATWLNSGYLSARHREGVERPSAVAPGEVVAYELRFHPSDTVVPAGHALRLVLSGSDDDTQPENSLHGVEIHRGVLVLPAKPAGWSPLDVTLGPSVLE